MAKLSIATKLNSVSIVGEFCNWNVEKSIEAKRKKDNKYIVVSNMPMGEYRVLSCKSYLGGEVYPTNGRQMPNRYFGGNIDEVISVYFEEEK